MLFDDEDKDQAQALRPSVVAPARTSPGARAKARSKRTPDSLVVHSFHTLVQALATLTKSRIQPRLAAVSETFDKISRPTALQHKALELLGLQL